MIYNMILYDMMCLSKQHLGWFLVVWVRRTEGLPRMQVFDPRAHCVRGAGTDPFDALCFALAAVVQPVYFVRDPPHERLHCLHALCVGR